MWAQGFRPAFRRDAVSVPAFPSPSERPITCSRSERHGPYTLMAACALTIDPEIMDAPIWHQSGSEPWSFGALGERRPQVYRTFGDTVRVVHAKHKDDVTIRI